MSRFRVGFCIEMAFHTNQTHVTGRRRRRLVQIVLIQSPGPIMQLGSMMNTRFHVEVGLNGKF